MGQFKKRVNERFKCPRIHTGENILTVSKKIVIETYGRQKKICMQLVLFFYSADLRTRFALVKKKYYFTHLLHK
jgi:hypothetical protein